MDNTEKKLVNLFGLFVGLLSMLMFIIHITAIIIRKGTLEGNYSQFQILIISILFLVTRKFLWGKYVQIISIMILCGITVYTEPINGYHISMIFILVLLSQKYGFLKKRAVMKLLIGFLLFIGLLVAGIIKQKITFFLIMPVITFLLLFMGSFSVIKSTEIKEYLENEKKLKREIESLRENLKTVTQFKNPIDYQFTPAEMTLLENLCLYKETNQKLGERLNKSEHTIKSQIRNILNKTEICDRYQLIDEFQYYYLEKSNIEDSTK